MQSRVALTAFLLVATLVGCDVGPVTVGPVEVPFRPFEGYYVAPGGATTPSGYAEGEFVFRTEPEWSGAVFEAKRADADLADSVVVAFAYGEVNACADGGHVERVVREGGRVTVALAPVVTPVPYCMANRPFQALAVVARADFPAGAPVAFEVPEGQEVPGGGAP